MTCLYSFGTVFYEKVRWIELKRMFDEVVSGGSVAFVLVVSERGIRDRRAPMGEVG